MTAAVLGASALLMGSASADEIIVKMVNKGSDGSFMAFEPAYIEANVGDTVIFQSTDPGHNAETIRGMIPTGAEAFKGKINEQIEYEVTVPGVYGIKCLPHYGMGMVALMVVGDPGNLDDAKAARQTGNAKKKFAALFDQLENDS